MTLEWWDGIRWVWNDFWMMEWLLNDRMTFEWWDDIGVTFWNDFWMIEWLLNDRMTLKWLDDIGTSLEWLLNDGMTSEWQNDFEWWDDIGMSLEFNGIQLSFNVIQWHFLIKSNPLQNYSASFLDHSIIFSHSEMRWNDNIVSLRSFLI